MRVGVIGCVCHWVTGLECSGLPMVRYARRYCAYVTRNGTSAVSVNGISPLVFVKGSVLTVRLELSFCAVYQFGRNQSINIDVSCLERVEQLKY